MSRLGAKTYSRKPEPKSNLQFEHLLSDKGNKPSTAKVSVAGFQRWGVASFTSRRKTLENGQQKEEAVKRVKVEPPPAKMEDPFSFETDLKPSIVVEAKPMPPRPNKFFKSGSRSTKKNDFDELRLSVPPKGTEHGVLHPNLRNNDSMEQQCAPFLSGTTLTPNILDLRCSNASTERPRNKFHDSASQAFDNLRAMTYASKKIFDAPVESADLFESREEEEIMEEPEPPGNSDIVETVEERSIPEVELMSSLEENFLGSHSEPVIPFSKSDPATVGFSNSENLFVPSSTYLSSQEEFSQGRPSSRATKKIFSSSLKQKLKASYNHRHWHSSKREVEEDNGNAQKLADEFEDELQKEEPFSDALVEKISESRSGEAVKSIQCPKTSKKLYTEMQKMWITTWPVVIQ